MLISLPFFLGWGFVAGFLVGYARKRGWTSFRLEFARFDFLTLPVLLFSALEGFNLASFASANAVAVYFAALMVGAGSGHWYFVTKSNVPRLTFIAVASVAVFSAALEYEYGLLRFLSKFEGAGVKIEFSDRAGKSQDPNLNRYARKNESGSANAFPGARRLDFVIDSLRKLGSYAIYDEQFARFFSSFDKTLSELDSNWPADRAKSFMEDSTVGYTLYTCDKTFQSFMADLSVIHDYQKSEISAFSIDPKLVEDLRLSYLTVLNGGNPASGALGKTMRDVNTTIVTKEFDLIKIFSEPPKKEPTTAEKKCSEFESMMAGRKTDRFAIIGTTDKIKNHYGYLGYFAITVALAEFAAENREAAIELLDKAVRYQTEEQNKSANANDIPNSELEDRCRKLIYPNQEITSDDKIEKCVSAFHELDAKRRIVVRARIEVFEDALIELSDNPALLDVRMPVTKHLIDDLDRSFALIDESGKNDNLFVGSVDDPESSDCSQDLAHSPEEQELLGRWTLARAVDKANAVATVAANRDIASAEPSLIATWDRYANAAASFSVRCATKLGAKTIPETQSLLLQSAGTYWEAKGNRFDRPERDEYVNISKFETLNALCKAKNAYRLAKRFYPDSKKPMSSDEEIPDINAYFEWFTTRAAITGLEDGADRVDEALKSYPVADIDKACL